MFPNRRKTFEREPTHHKRPMKQDKGTRGLADARSADEVVAMTVCLCRIASLGVADLSV